MKKTANSNPKKMKFMNWTKIISEKLFEDGLSPKFLSLLQY
jgi:hypothetical protein